jgi:hypothetical protein
MQKSISCRLLRFLPGAPFVASNLAIRPPLSPCSISQALSCGAASAEASATRFFSPAKPDTCSRPPHQPFLSLPSCSARALALSSQSVPLPNPCRLALRLFVFPIQRLRIFVCVYMSERSGDTRGFCTLFVVHGVISRVLKCGVCFRNRFAAAIPRSAGPVRHLHLHEGYSLELLKKFGVKTPRFQIAKTAEEAQTAARALGAIPCTFLLSPHCRGPPALKSDCCIFLFWGIPTRIAPLTQASWMLALLCVFLLPPPLFFYTFCL